MQMFIVLAADLVMELHIHALLVPFHFLTPPPPPLSKQLKWLLPFVSLTLATVKEGGQVSLFLCSVVSGTVFLLAYSLEEMNFLCYSYMHLRRSFQNKVGVI